MMRLLMGIEGMTCTSCSSTVENGLRDMEGVLSATVTLATNRAQIDYDPSITNALSIKDTVECLGFGGSILEDSEIQSDKAEETNVEKKIIFIVNSCSSFGGNPGSLSEDISILTTPQASQVSHALLALEGVIAASVKNEAGESSSHIHITYNDTLTGPRIFNDLLAELGVRATACQMGGFLMANLMAKQREKETHDNFVSLCAAAAFTLPIVILADVLPMSNPSSIPPYISSALHHEILPGLSVNSLLLLLFCTPVQFGLGMRFHSKAYKSIKNGNLGMDFLVSTGTSAAYCYSLFAVIGAMSMSHSDTAPPPPPATGSDMGGMNMGGDGSGSGMSAVEQNSQYLETAAVLITVVLLGKYLESYARGVTASAINSLSALRSPTARLVPSTTPLTSSSASVGAAALASDRIIDSALIHRGDLLRLVEGESVPADGTVFAALGVDESMMTGESRMAHKKAGDVVYGGTVVMQGSCLMRVTACGDNSTLGKIVATVQEAQSSRPPIQELADHVARYFVPAIAAISLLTFVLWTSAWLLGVVPVSWYQGSHTDALEDRKCFFLFAFLFSLAVWVSACPCAFGLATPTAVLVSTGMAAQLGVLVRKGAALQYAAEVDTVAFDKTGTLTHGKTVLSDLIMISTDGERTANCFRKFIPFVLSATKSSSSSSSSSLSTSTSLVRSSEDSEDDHLCFIRMLMSAEMRSSHPLAKGVSEFCKSRLSLSHSSASPSPSLSRARNEDDVLSPIDGDLEVVPGQGVRFTVSGSAAQLLSKAFRPDGMSGQSTCMLVGSPLLMTDNKIRLTPTLQRTANGLRAGGKVAVYVAVNGSLRAVLGVSDTVRAEAAEVVEMLRRRGVECFMITGDEPSTAYAIGSVTGIPRENIHAGAKPQDKERLVGLLQSQGRKVAFVGDGTNDSPALARAHVGIAMSSGTSIAIEAGDMVLCKDDLRAVVTALDLSKKTLNKIKWNYGWALIYNAFLVPVAAGLFFPAYHLALAPSLAGLAMAASSVSIVLSSLLLMWYQPPQALTVSSLNPTEAYQSESSLEELCNCPVSAAPVFDPTPESWSELMFKDLENFLYNCGLYLQSLFDSSSRRSREGAGGLVYDSLSGMDESNRGGGDNNNAVYDVEAAGAGSVVVGSGGIAMSDRRSRSKSLSPPPARTASSSQPSLAGGCSCGKGNCRCGQACMCGKPANKTSSVMEEVAGVTI